MKSPERQKWVGWMILLTVFAVVGGRYLWILSTQPSQRQREIAAAFGSVALFYGSPQPDHAGNRVTYVGTADVGFGVMLVDVATGRKQNVRQPEPGTIELDTPKLQVWPWSPDDRSFVYSDTGKILICDADAGKVSAEIKIPTSVAGLSWLTPTALACLGANGDLYQFERQTDGSWRRKPANLMVRSIAGTGLASSEDKAGGATAGKAFEPGETPGWSSGNTTNQAWLEYHFDGPAWAITQYTLTSSPDHADADPRDWQLLGSDDGFNWTTLDTRTGETFASRTQTKPYALTNETPYWYYRLNVTGTAGGEGGVRLAKFQLWSEDTRPVASANAENAPNESAAAAFDGSSKTKWFNGFAPLPDWLQYQFGGGAAWDLSEYAVTSANDLPDRDPEGWQFQASNDGKSWTTLDTRADERFASRLETKSYSFANSTPYRYYRLYITASEPTVAHPLQLAELDLGLRSRLARINAPDGGFALRSLGGIASASSAMRGFEANKAFDRIETTGWFSGKTNGPVWLQYEFIAPAWAITQYKLISATNNAGADPRDWQLQGSNDRVNWANLDTRTNQTFAARAESKRYQFANHTPYRYYRLNISGTAGGQDSGVALAEFQLWSESTPGAASASAENPPGESAASAFDDSHDTKWYNANAAQTGWLQYESGGGAGWALSKYALTSANDVPDRDPKNWQLQASNDGLTWTNLDTRTNQSFESRFQTQPFFFINSTPYRIYRLNITAASGSDSGLQLAEFGLDSKDSPTNKTIKPKDATPGGNPLVGAFSFTSLSTNTVAFGQSDSIWTMNFASNVPVLLLNFKEVAPPGTVLRSFSYARENGQFLLTCAQGDNDSLYFFDSNNPAVGLHQISTTGAVRDAVWLNGGGRNNWVGLQEGLLVAGHEAGSEPMRGVSFASLDTLSVSADGKRLFAFGTTGDEPSSGLWRFDVASAKLQTVVPYADHPSPAAEAMSHESTDIRTPTGEPLHYEIFQPANLDNHPGRQYPLVIGNTQLGVALRGVHGRLWAPALAASGAYVIIINRDDWWKGIEKWGDNVMAVYNLVTNTLPIDKNRVFLFGASAETSYMSKFMTNSPGLWRGAIFLNPTGLPDFSDAPAGQRRPRILISAGGLERQDTRFKRFQTNSLNDGVAVDFVISPGEGHHFVGNAAQLQRAEAMLRFIFDE